MRRSYEFPLHFQEGWSSLQTRLRSPRDRHRGSSLQTGRLGIFRGTTTSRMCSKNLSIAPTCRSWVNTRFIFMAMLLSIFDLTAESQYFVGDMNSPHAKQR